MFLSLEEADWIRSKKAFIPTYLTHSRSIVDDERLHIRIFRHRIFTCYFVGSLCSFGRKKRSLKNRKSETNQRARRRRKLKIGKERKVSLPFHTLLCLVLLSFSRRQAAYALALSRFSDSLLFFFSSLLLLFSLLLFLSSLPPLPNVSNVFSVKTFVTLGVFETRINYFIFRRSRDEKP